MVLGYKCRMAVSADRAAATVPSNALYPRFLTHGHTVFKMHTYNVLRYGSSLISGVMVPDKKLFEIVLNSEEKRVNSQDSTSTYIIKRDQ